MAVLVVVAGLGAGCARAATPDDASQTRTLPSQVTTACSEAYDAVVTMQGVSIERSDGVVDDALPLPVSGCRLVVSGSLAQAGDTDGATGRLADHFSRLGWRELLEYAADGKDGTTFAVERDEVSCHVRGEWNGGSDGEPEVPAEDWYKVTVICVAGPLPFEP